jgi:two-component system, NarL family, response regulator DegU
MNNIKVAIADDHRLFREGIRALITAMKGIVLCLEAENGRDLLEQLRQHTADILLLDIEMKDMNGVDTLGSLKTMHPQLKVIILSMHTEARMISYMMERGANGYLQKDIKKEELETALRTTYEKGFYFNETVSNSLLEGLKTKNKKTTTLPQHITLTGREKEVLMLICQEHTTGEIAEKLFISERTVEGHRKNLCAKLEVKNTAGLVKKALLFRLVDLA